MDAQTRFPASADWSAVMPSYEWPRNTEEQDIDYVYHGRMDNLPRSTSKTVRIFLSSTFTDTYTERNLLMKNVFPEMRKYCRDKYDLDFQVVDMRWGVRHEASVDHNANELCLKEIKTCNEVSLGPTFVTLLSHRYGSRPLRTRIPESEMDILMEELKKRPADLEVVLKWYQQDTNALPHEYLLKPLVRFEDIEKFLQSTEKDRRATKNHLYSDDNCDDEGGLDKSSESKDKPKNYQDLLQNGNEQFQLEEVRLRQIFKEVALGLLKEKRLTKEQAERYYISVTEDEIIEGIRKNERRRDRCLAFIRQLNDIDLKHDKAWRFIDMTDNNELDTEAQQLMTTLRDKTIPQLLPAENIYRFEATWSNDEGINEQAHAQYLQQFCDTFKRALIEQIDRGVHASKFTTDKLFSEILEHGHQCVAKVERFHGREEILNTIKDYIMSGGKQPLIIWGESGCGKTSVLAKAAQMVPEWLGDNTHLIIAVRFLGTTPDSCSIYQTLASICQQLIKLCALESQFPELPQEFADLKDLFSDILAAIPDTKRAVLLLDSLDQLTDANAAHELHWFPKTIPSNVKIIVSVLPKEHNILKKLKEMLTDETYFIEVPNIETETSHAILKLWLHIKNRKLSDMQNTLIDELLKTGVRPLYLKLVFDEVCAWKSYEKPTFNCKTIESCLVRLYRRIETKHGQVLISKALGYLSASANGLTELEIEDILSLDEDVLNDVFEFHIPPIRRLPSILWARVRRDLDEYIVDREADGTKVMAWYHRQFIQEANKRYLGVSAGYYGAQVEVQQIPIYRNLRDYFAGIWYGETPKPFIYSDWHCQKRNLKDPNSQEVRHVSAQPTIFAAPDGSIDIENPRYNLRKISELPHACEQIAKVDMTEMTPFIAKHIILNPEFLGACIKNKPWSYVSEFITDHSRESEYGDKSKEYTQIFKKQFEGEEISAEDKELLEKAKIELKGNTGLVLQMSTIHQCLLLSYISFMKNPSFLAADVAGRLLVYHGILDGIDEWIDYCDTKGRQLCALIAPHSQLETPGSELLFVITNHDGPIADAMWSTTDDNLCCSLSSKLVVISMEMGQVLIDTHPRSIPARDSFQTGVVCNKTIIACLARHPWVYIFNETGDVMQIIKLEQEIEEFGVHQIVKIKQADADDSDAPLIILLKDYPHLICVKYHKKEKIYKATVLRRICKGAVLNFMSEENEEPMYILSDNSNISRLQFDDDYDLFEVKSESVVLELEGRIASHDVVQDRAMVGTKDPNSTHLLQIQNHKLNQYIYRGNVKYGYCHHVQLSNKKSDDSSYDMLSVGCTDTHLLLLLPENGGGKSDEDSDSSSDSEISSDSEASVDSDTSDNTRPTTGDSELDIGKTTAVRMPTKTTKSETKRKYDLKLMFRVKRRYNLANVTPGNTLLIAARGGTLDLFQLDIDSEDAELKGVTGRFFTTIDAHGFDITKILITNEDVLFMTASNDETMKFWMVARAGITRKYIPNFDRGDVIMDELQPDKETTLAFGYQSRSVYEWDVLKGKIARIFEHPSKKGKFVAFATDKTKTKLYALDVKDTIYIYNIDKEARVKARRGLARKATSKHGLEESRKVIETPSDTVSLANTAIPLNAGQRNKYSMILLHVSNGLIVVGGDDRYYHVQLGSTVQAHRIEEDVSVRIYHQISDKSILFKSNDTSTFQLYDVETKTFAHTLVDDIAPGNPVVVLAKYNSMPPPERYVHKTAEVLIYSTNEIILWNPLSGKKRSTGVKCTDDLKVVTCKSGLCLLYSKLSGKYQGMLVTNDTIRIEPWERDLAPDCDHLTLTHDGKYIVYIINGKMLHLRRYSDNKLLALYTMYDYVCSMKISTNNWFVILSTSDKRLFTLLIADPNERDHDDRIAYVRAMNPGLSMEQAMALMGDANAFEGADSDIDSDYDSSDDESLMRAAERRMDKRGVNRDVVFCLQSEDESSSDSDGDTRPGTRQIMTRESTMVQVYSNGVLPTAHDGQIFAPDPCSVQ